MIYVTQIIGDYTPPNYDAVNFYFISGSEIEVEFTVDRKAIAVFERNWINTVFERNVQTVFHHDSINSTFIVDDTDAFVRYSKL